MSEHCVLKLPFTCRVCAAAVQSEVCLPSPLSETDVQTLAALARQLNEMLFREAAATFLSVRELNPDSVLCSGCVPASNYCWLASSCEDCTFGLS